MSQSDPGSKSLRYYVRKGLNFSHQAGFQGGIPPTSNQPRYCKQPSTLPRIGVDFITYDDLNRMQYARENGTVELAYYTYDPLSRRRITVRLIDERGSINRRME